MQSSNLRRSFLSLAVAFAALSAGSAMAADEVAPALKAALQQDLGMSSAQIPQYMKVERTARQQAVVAKRQLGAGFAGEWIESKPDGSFAFVVANSGARTVAIPGVEVRRVRHSMSRLQASMNLLDDSTRNRVPGISRNFSGVHSWGVDPQTNSVVVAVAPGARDEAIDLVALSGADTATLRFVESVGEPSLLATLQGGIAYQYTPGGQNACSVGIPARRGTSQGFATAGHCGRAGQSVAYGGAAVGSFVLSNFPGTDRAFVQLGSGHSIRPEVSNYSGGVVAVRGSAEAPVGAAVCRSGLRTNYRCGTVTRKNVSVNYSQGRVNGLTQANTCAGRGDSGGAWITPAGQAQGVTSGGNINSSNTNCNVPASQVVTWFDPINPILSQYGLTLLTQ